VPFNSVNPRSAMQHTSPHNSLGTLRNDVFGMIATRVLPQVSDGNQNSSADSPCRQPSIRNRAASLENAHLSSLWLQRDTDAGAL